MGEEWQVQRPKRSRYYTRCGPGIVKEFETTFGGFGVAIWVYGRRITRRNRDDVFIDGEGLDFFRSYECILRWLERP